MQANRVAIVDAGERGYPDAPYSPDRAYPEYRLGQLSKSPNAVYAGVRETFRLLGMDAARYGTAEWNPLGEFIRPGARVLIKPNLVRHYHPRGMDAGALVTHGSVIRAVCDYALLAAGQSGEVVIADAPLQSCDFAAVRELAGLDTLTEFYGERGIDPPVRDLRLMTATVHAGLYGKVVVQQENAGDPRGYRTVDLGEKSLHSGREVGDGEYRVMCYDPSRMRRHHGAGRHEYVVANTLLEADVVLNLPKMKTHQKAGLTGALKNFVGINGHKDCLPHHVRGAASRGGDEYPRASRIKELDTLLVERMESGSGPLAKKTMAVAHRVLSALHMREKGNNCSGGAWWGNDTISRTTVDLNRIVRHAGRDGAVCDTARRTVFSLIDGIVGGDQDGPLAPRPRYAGVLIGGVNPVAVDIAMARVMGFDYRRIPTLRHALAAHELPLVCFGGGAVETVSNEARWSGLDVERGGDSLAFEPHYGWRGHIEL